MANNVKKINKLPHYVSDEMMEEIIENLKGRFAPLETQSNAGITEARAGTLYINSNDYYVPVEIENFKYLEVFLESAETLFIWYNGNVLYDEKLRQLQGDIYVEEHGFQINWFGVGSEVALHWKAFK